MGGWEDESLRAGRLVPEVARAERGIRPAALGAPALGDADRTDFRQRPQPAAVHTLQGARPRGVELRQSGDRAEHRRGTVPAEPQFLLLDRHGVLTMRALKTGSVDMKRAFTGLALAVAVGVGACDFEITNPNSPPPIGPNATADQVKAAAVGTLVAVRVDVSRWVLAGAILGREGDRLDTADPRFTTELLHGPLDPSNDAFGGGQWAAEYRAIQSGYQILNVIGSAQIAAGERNGVRGVVHTIQAVPFLMELNAHTHDSIPVDVNRTVSH